MKTLNEALQDVPRHRKLYRVEEILLRLDEADCEALERALRNQQLSSAHISNILRSFGHPISASSVRNYRREVLNVA